MLCYMYALADTHILSKPSQPSQPRYLLRFELICPLQAYSPLDSMSLIQKIRKSTKSGFGSPNSIGPSAKDPKATTAGTASPKPPTKPAHRTVDKSNGLPAPVPALASPGMSHSSTDIANSAGVGNIAISSFIKPHKYVLTEFHVDRTLGTGSFGRVHIVKSKSNGKYFAMKVLRKADIVRMAQVEHTVSEKAILEQLKFPFLVSLIGTFQDCQNVYLVMEYVQGGELFSYLRRCG
ncbi:hypothetical protein SeMB42_g06823, partial [Synchytrium endobioticum]